jgi:hypothetical protein
LIRYSRACGFYQDFLDIWLLLTRKQLNQGLLLVKLKLSLRKIYGRHHDLVSKDRKYNDQKKKDKRRNNALQNIHIILKN